MTHMQSALDYESYYENNLTVYKNGDKCLKSVFVTKTVTFVKITVTFVKNGDICKNNGDNQICRRFGIRPNN